MSPLFTSIVIVMGLLAVMGIVVGVANDAVNFLNSALGSKAAPRRVILWIAAAGILVGTLTSSGMMEVARSGVFYPGQFSFQEIMMLFLGMMLGNILLLDIYNTLGLPTSTTVSLIFCLLGSAIAVSIYKISNTPDLGVGALGQFIKLLSVKQDLPASSSVRRKHSFHLPQKRRFPTPGRAAEHQKFSRPDGQREIGNRVLLLFGICEIQMFDCKEFHSLSSLRSRITGVSTSARYTSMKLTVIGVNAAAFIVG